MDVNDNPPQFTRQLYNGSIVERSVPSVEVMIVSYDISLYTLIISIITV